MTRIYGGDKGQEAAQLGCDEEFHVMTSLVQRSTSAKDPAFYTVAVEHRGPVGLTCF